MADLPAPASVAARPRAPDVVVLVAVTMLSLGLITGVDDLAARALASSPLLFFAWIRLPSLIVCAGIYLATGPGRSYQWPARTVDWKRVGALFVAWLVPTGILVLVFRVYVPTIRGLVDTTAFMVTGLLGEELLFRGAIFQLAERVFADKTLLRVPLPVLISALSFGVAHVQYHHFQLTAAAMTQVGYAVVMGVFFGLVRSTTGSLWPGVALHMANNSFTLLRAL